MEIQFTPITVGSFEVNCFIVHNDQHALIIDPGDDAPMITDYVSQHQLQVSAYLLTHGHADHVSALAACDQAMPAPIYMHETDTAWAFSAQNSILPYYPQPTRPATSLSPLQEGQTLSLDAFHIKILHTPGHTPGGTCFYFEEQTTLISGDTLFSGSVGRTDLPGGDARTLSNSLKQLARLPESTQVLPGHGPRTTIAQEKRNNIYLQRLPA